jgi:uncharacterized protein YndB with AHSA1/START domain
MTLTWVEWGADRSVNAAVPGRVLEARRPERLVFEWGDPGSESTVEIVLEEVPDGTIVRLREYGFRTLDSLIGNAGGWGEALTLWKVWVEHGIATNR